jgi:glutamine synthetase
MRQDNKIDNIIKDLKKQKVAFVRFFFPDILGDACDFSIPLEEFEKAMKGRVFDGSSIHGMARIDESDLIARPDLKTLRVFPWVYRTKTLEKEWREAIVFCDILNPDKSYYEGDTRFVLKRILQELKDFADNFYVGAELEFFLFKADDDGKPLIKDGKPILMDSGKYFKGGRFGEVRKEIQLILKKMQVTPEYDHHEAAHSQHEIDYQYMNALKMADTILLLKYVTKRVARKYNLFASFMPKPIMEINGNGMHINQSLFKQGKNLFYDKNNKYNLSETALNYLGGLFKHIKEITSVLNQYVNSYKRLVPGYEAPCYITWAFRNRSDLIRIPIASEKAVRIELRSPDPCCNPYLAFALILKTGLDGIKNKINFPKPVEENVYKLSEKERKAKGIESLPFSLKEALELTKRSSFVRQIFGEHLFNKFIENKKKHLEEYEKSFTNKKEFQEYDLEISPYEIENLLLVL